MNPVKTGRNVLGAMDMLIVCKVMTGLWVYRGRIIGEDETTECLTWM